MTHYDIIIAGGGIHGVGVAQAAAARGYRTLLIEQTALADGTSSRSSKLIHGGLRYLEHAHFSLVRECLRERAILLKTAPDLVKLRPFHIPIYSTTRRRPWQIQLGLGLYAILTGLDKTSHFQRLPADQWNTLDGLMTDRLQAVFRYYDAQTDDAALTRAVMNSAQQLGAELAMPARLLTAELHDQGCRVCYRANEREYCCESSVLVNATGPWVNQLLDSVSPRPQRQAIDLVQGAHIIVTGQLSQGCYYLEAPADQRAVFAMPWKDNILVGTTETRFSGDPSQVRPLEYETSYLWDTLAYYFPAYRNQQHRMISSFAGLRVLPGGDVSAFRKPRETILLTDRPQQPRLLSIYGGKLTVYRATAQKVMSCLQQSLPPPRQAGDTTKIAL